VKLFRTLVLLFIIAATLLNSNAFGSPSLIAWFGYVLVACFFGILSFPFLITSKYRATYRPPLFTITFCIFSFYVFVEGLKIDKFTFSHYYIITSAIFIVAINIFSNFTNFEFNSKYNLPSLSVTIHAGIFFLATLESFIVLLQFINLFPVPTNLFSCTGTWINPNVTAMFLALSIWSFTLLKPLTLNFVYRYAYYTCFFILITAIILLQCRTAYLMTGVLILTTYRNNLIVFVKQNLKFNSRGILLVLTFLLVIQIVFSIFERKSASTFSRLQIWKGSAELIYQQPINGFGFGRFERVYNFYAASKMNPINDYVTMAYNDFAELGVEGGIIAILLWCIFLYFVWKEVCFSKFSNTFTPVLISFIILQLTNFGFQAIPAYVLFLIYSAIHPQPQIQLASNNRSKQNYTIAIIGISISILLIIKVAALCGAFYEKWILTGNGSDNPNSTKILTLESRLKGFTSYHESLGDAYIKEKQLLSAIVQFKKALNSSSEPMLFLKTGVCYQMKKNYDSSKYFLKVAKNMQPQKLTPRLYLLNLYLDSKDTINAELTSREIIEMPVKVKNKKAVSIKQYAKAVNDSLRIKMDFKK
jgi:O-antigen polymerase